MPQALSRSFSSTRSYMKFRLLGLKRRWLRGFIWCPQRNWGWTSTRSTNPGMLRQEESFECGDSFRAKGRKSAWPGSQEAGTSSSCSKQVENQQVPDKSNGFQIQESLWIGRNGWGHPLGGRSCSWREDKTSLGAFLRAELSEKAWVELGECKWGEGHTGMVVHSPQEEPPWGHSWVPASFTADRFFPAAFSVHCLLPAAFGETCRNHGWLWLWGLENDRLRILTSLSLSNLYKQSWRSHTTFGQWSERSFSISTS